MTDKSQWDHKRAALLQGATVLVGLTFEEAAGPRQEQFYGTVMEVDPMDGVLLRLEGSRAGETYRLPPHLDAFTHAAPGDYRLRQTGEVVKDPDFTTSWTINPPSS